MNKYYRLTKDSWDKTLLHMISQYDLYAPVEYAENQDYELIDPDLVPQIVYNKPKPTTPLKTFFLPIKENVVNISEPDSQRIIMGIPSCDLAALNIQDEMYLNRDFEDPAYKKHRNRTILIGTDCHSTLEHCHCTTYDVKPYPEKNQDITLIQQGDSIYLYTQTNKGDDLINMMKEITAFSEPTENEIQTILNKREEMEHILEKQNQSLPGYQKTGQLVGESGEDIWHKYSKTCVSCGACATACPTCTCFILLEKPGFEKVRNLDACQYPGFEKVAAGEDPLGALHKRFYNRYMCKYVWKPQKFESTACTGCGRCIEACIGNINKNELFMELSNA